MTRRGPPSAHRRQYGLHPLDLVVVLRLTQGAADPVRTIARDTGFTSGTVARSIQRLRQARLLAPVREPRQVLRLGLLTFLEHGVRYAFPPLVGSSGRGVPTAHAAPVLVDVVEGDDPWVWPASGDDALVEGRTLVPLCPQAATFPERCPPLYDLLALVDALRVGRARARAAALQRLGERIPPAKLLPESDRPPADVPPTPTPLIALVGSPAVAQLLLFFLLDLDRAAPVRELQHHTGLASATLIGALDRLVQTGFLRGEGDPGARSYRIHSDHPALFPLAEAVRRLADPAEVLASAFQPLFGLAGLVLYGSLAAGIAHDESDVDVLVIGDELDDEAVARAARGVSRVLGREVNVGVARAQEIRDGLRAGHPFLTRVLYEAPVRWVIGRPEQLLGRDDNSG